MVQHQARFTDLIALPNGILTFQPIPSPSHSTADLSLPKTPAQLTGGPLAIARASPSTYFVVGRDVPNMPNTGFTATFRTLALLTDFGTEQLPDDRRPGQSKCVIVVSNGGRGHILYPLISALLILSPYCLVR